MSKTHTIIPAEKLDFRARAERASAFDMFEGIPKECRVKVIFFKKGSKIRRHFHSKGPIYKVLLKGKLQYDEQQIFEAGSLAWVDQGVSYEADVLEDSYLLLIEPRGSEITE